VAGPTPIIEYMRYNAPTYVFTKAVPLVMVAATRKALDLVRDGDDRRARVWQNRKLLQEGLIARGFSIGNTESPITPIQFQGNDALHVAHKLRTSYGIWSAPAVYPAVPRGRSILRVIPTALHTAADIDYLLEGLTSIRASMILGAMAQV
jgi:glycine C-acetyltransferase